MYVVTFYPDEMSRDLLVAEMFDRGTEGIAETSITIKAFFNDRGQAESAAADFLHFDPEIDLVEERDYVSEWKGEWPPVEVGEKFYLVPEWRDDAAPEGRIRLRVHPGMAFGTGKHQSTQLCLMALEKVRIQGRFVVDLGTGSGILAAGCVLLGASEVWAIDNDPDAVEVARENLAADGLQARFDAGSIAMVPDESVDVLLANILGPTHEQLAGEYRRVLKPGGHLIVSGFESHEVDGVREAIGWDERRNLKQDSWHALIFEK